MESWCSALHAQLRGTRMRHRIEWQLLRGMDIRDSDRCLMMSVLD
jgi:hypothetical protein